MPSGKPFNKQEIENYIRENAGKKTLEEMSKELGAAESTVNNYCWRMGISYELDEKRQKREDIETAILNYHKKMTGVDIAKMLGVTHTAVNSAAKRLKVALIRVRKEKRPAPFSGMFRWRDFNNSMI